MAIMYKIMVRCSVTGKRFDSQLRTSGREMLGGALLGQGVVNCPYCRQIHEFDGNSNLEFDSDASGNALWRPNR